MTVFHTPKGGRRGTPPLPAIVESTCKQIGRDLLAFSRVHLSQDDIVQAFIPKPHHAAYAKIVDFLAPHPHHAQDFMFTVEGGFGAAAYVAQVPYPPLATRVVPSCPKATREKLAAFSDERAQAVVDAANIFDVFTALNDMLSSFHQFKFLFAGFEAIMREAPDVFAVQLKLVDDYKRPASLPKISPELATAIKSAQATIAKWTLLRGAEKPEAPNNALKVRGTLLPARRLSWDSATPATFWELW